MIKTTTDAMEKEAVKVAYHCEVTRVMQWKDGRISFDMRVNGVQIDPLPYLPGYIRWW